MADSDDAYAYLKGLYPTLDDMGDLLAAFVNEHQGGSWTNVMSEEYWPGGLALLVPTAALAINAGGDVLLINDAGDRLLIS